MLFCTSFFCLVLPTGQKIAHEEIAPSLIIYDEYFPVITIATAAANFRTAAVDLIATASVATAATAATDIASTNPSIATAITIATITTDAAKVFTAATVDPSTAATAAAAAALAASGPSTKGANAMPRTRPLNKDKLIVVFFC